MSPRFAKYLLLAASAAYVNGQTKILVSNDDGWAVANVRAFFNSLGEQGYNLVMSAPAENKSGTGSSDATPTPLDSSGCEFSSCPGNSPAIGSNSTDPRFNYVNSFPATSVEFGVQSIAPPLFGGTSPDLVVAGPNVGSNLGSTVLISGTVGAACEAVKLGIPAIAFSGSSGSQVSYMTLSSSSSSTTAALVYASLSTTVTKTLLAAPFNASAPILPQGIALNVNFPSTTGNCKSASAFSFVLTRINSAASGAAADVETCGRARLPTESSTVSTSGCISSISVMNATTKGDVDATTQALVLNKLGSLLTCP